MINSQTVLILGAGASAEYGFPVGAQLINDIIDYYKNPAFKKLTALICELDKYEYPALTNLEYASNEDVRHCVEYSPIVQPKNSFVDEFINALKQSHTASIDDFLYHHEKYRLIGKVSILLNLIKKERSYNQEQQGWYSYLWKVMDQGTDGMAEKILNNKIKIITFNYERSLEHFLYTALLNMYSFKNPEDAIEIINQIPIYHVYGRLGKLSWQDNEMPISDFGESLETGSHLGMIQETADNVKSVLDRDVFDQCKHILSIAKSIKIYHEEQDQTAEYQKIISETERIYFLGFGFHPQNMQALGLNEKILNSRVFSTTYGLGNKEAFNVKEHLVSLGAQVTQPAGLDNTLWSENHRYNNMKILEYFKEVAPLE